MLIPQLPPDSHCAIASQLTLSACAVADMAIGATESAPVAAAIQRLFVSRFLAVVAMFVILRSFPDR